MLGRLNGQIAPVPGPGRHPRGGPVVKDAVAAGLAALIDEHRQAVAGFGADTREDTLERAADKIRATQFKVAGVRRVPARREGRGWTGSWPPPGTSCGPRSRPWPRPPAAVA